MARIKLTDEERKEIARQASAAYRAKNLKKVRQRQREYYEANKEQILEEQKKYRDSHKEKIKEIGKKYQEANREKIRAYQRKYYEKKRKEYISLMKKQHAEIKKAAKVTAPVPTFEPKRSALPKYKDFIKTENDIRHYEMLKIQCQNLRLTGRL